eukprot:393413_1
MSWAGNVVAQSSPTFTYPNDILGRHCRVSVSGYWESSFQWRTQAVATDVATGISASHKGTKSQNGAKQWALEALCKKLHFHFESIRTNDAAEKQRLARETAEREASEREFQRLAEQLRQQRLLKLTAQKQKNEQIKQARLAMWEQDTKSQNMQKVKAKKHRMSEMWENKFITVQPKLTNGPQKVTQTWNPTLNSSKRNYLLRKIDKWSNDDIIHWMKNLLADEDDMTEQDKNQLISGIIDRSVVGEDLMSVDYAEDIGHSFGIIENMQLCNNIYKDIQKLKLNLVSIETEDSSEQIVEHVTLNQNVLKKTITLQNVKSLYKEQSENKQKMKDEEYQLKYQQLMPSNDRTVQNQFGAEVEKEECSVLLCDNANKSDSLFITNQILNLIQTKAHEEYYRTQTNNTSSGTGHQKNHNNNDKNDQNEHGNRKQDDDNHNRQNQSDDDDEKKDEEYHKKQTKDDDDYHEDEDIERFMILLSNMKNLDDVELHEKLKTFPTNVFKKVAKGINELNESIQRISSISTKLPAIQPVIIPEMTQQNSTNIVESGYSSKSESCHGSISQREAMLRKNQLLISGYIRNTVPNENMAICVINAAANTVNEILQHFKKPKKKVRKRRNKTKSVIKTKYRYEPKITAKPNIEHEKQIKQFIMTKKWYNKKAIKNAEIHGAAEYNGRITLSLEVSEFMRRCERVVEKLKEENREINLTPVGMKDMKDNLTTQYLFVSEIDSVRHINVGVCFECIEFSGNMDVVVTGFHLNRKLLSSVCDSTCLAIGYLNIYSQTEEHYQERYNKVLLFVQEFIVTGANGFIYSNWKKKAEKLWKELVGTVM